VHSDRELMVKVDTQLFGEVMANLLRNAAEACRGVGHIEVRTAREGARAVRGEMPAAGDSTALGALTPREREVFQLLALGKANKEVAAMLDLSLGTVKKHRENLQRKLDCHSAAELARMAIREGLLNV